MKDFSLHDGTILIPWFAIYFIFFAYSFHTIIHLSYGEKEFIIYQESMESETLCRRNAVGIRFAVDSLPGVEGE